MTDSPVALLARRLLDDGSVDTALQAFVAAQLIMDAADALNEQLSGDLSEQGDITPD